MIFVNYEREAKTCAVPRDHRLLANSDKLLLLLSLCALGRAAHAEAEVSADANLARRAHHLRLAHPPLKPKTSLMAFRFPTPEELAERKTRIFQHPPLEPNMVRLSYVSVEASTDKAVLVKLEDGAAPRWIPKSALKFRYYTGYNNSLDVDKDSVIDVAEWFYNKELRDTA